MNEQKAIGIIPARYASTRLEGKPLARIGSKSMVQMVYERACESRLLESCIVAADDQRIYDHVLDFGGEAAMTSQDIATGTDRCWAVARERAEPIVVNIQGDEPLIDPAVIDECVQALLDNPEAVCATPVVASRDPQKARSPHVVKVAMNQRGEALYFSRSPIPFDQNPGEVQEYYLHIGLYAYRRDFLEKYVSMERSDLEKRESLEQLRILENGYRVQCCLTRYESLGVDTAEELAQVRQLLGVAEDPLEGDML